MILLRITEGIRSHFPARKSEWVLAGLMTGWGLWLLLWGPQVFTDSRAYATMVRWGAMVANDPQAFWGWFALAIGLVRLLALIINGTFIETWYGRWSPHVRSGLSYLSSAFFLWIAIGILIEPGRSTGEVTFTALAVLDLLNARDASNDAGAVDRGRSK